MQLLELVQHNNQVRKIKWCIHYEKVIFRSSDNDEWTVKVAKTVQEAIDLVQVGFDYVTEMIDNGQSVKIFRKRK